MKTYNELYGADADGNRGVWIKEYDIEDSDSTNIVEQLYEDFVNGSENGIRTVFLIDDKTEEDIELEVELEVEIEDYLAELVKKAREDESLKEDEEIQEWLKTFK